ncbi:MAG: Grx4 family monothiol glutaredoxin [Alphaproteobacteria bacterium]|nr:Grx4 family monothiol glutaredoxin [Alphaproteobacteria bacterium]
MSDIQSKIKELVETNDVVLFMKGAPDFPQCGFSSTVVQILNQLGVKCLGVNILEDQDMRQGIKDYTNWPTLPQLYIKGEFIGGCDIVKEMFQAGELQALLVEKQIV